MKNNLSNKTILITGAAGGIGEALCTSFAEANGTIILHYNSNRDKAESLLQKLPGMHHRAIQCDLSNADQVNTMFSAIDHVDIVINNAAVVENHEIDSLSYQDWQDIWERTIGANLIGPANIMYLASKFMIKNGGGKFINISSTFFDDKLLKVGLKPDKIIIFFAKSKILIGFPISRRNTLPNFDIEPDWITNCAASGIVIK